MARGWIGVDLDGTLAHYEHGSWRGPLHIGQPVPEMVDRVRRWLDEGHDVRVFTARCSGPRSEAVEAIAAIQKWCQEHIGAVLPVTNVKYYAMLELWDDRAVTVEPNTGRPLAPSSRGLS
jgi:hypothetical protein